MGGKSKDFVGQKKGNEDFANRRKWSRVINETEVNVYTREQCFKLKSSTIRNERYLQCGKGGPTSLLRIFQLPLEMVNTARAFVFPRSSLCCMVHHRPPAL